MSFTLLYLFIPTFFLVSITPGMCMTLALSLGISIGVKRSLHMMWGELIGVSLVATSAALGVATLMLKYPDAFLLLKLGGGAYLCWIGYQMFRSRGKLVLTESTQEQPELSRLQLASNGFLTAVANPKGWAFFVTLLPPFIDSTLPIAPQLSMLIAIILLLEFICLLIYANGGKLLRQLLMKRDNVRLMNRIAGSLMIIVGLWLALGK
ncbi:MULTISPECIES: LysE family translocator [unclassified Neptuniibacter]|jgi:threonine/homoserine/homoserine lactone efflux protein|uniref:LysE family translocator n=1 Tax=unclassified Neptuniibacter TaxID=2630693 RepID=UPI0026E2FF82|nr:MULTISPECIES: LysE family translocator [unclassified Neptuniibacter]MDO6515068.1 LysE family translocator [Neptuniibacter sp. 2_MG-2023]MDO6594874.1 LysE family translocator [Neptuniibacter sp. 1_MG-2023]